ncbi:hypothetical protein N7512_004166 [Penicillium capsulatum]|nr:hypothetical protein N7512_004166 [Penicillium capsulatum]
MPPFFEADQLAFARTIRLLSSQWFYRSVRIMLATQNAIVDEPSSRPEVSVVGTDSMQQAPRPLPC